MGRCWVVMVGSGARLLRGHCSPNLLLSLNKYKLDRPSANGNITAWMMIKVSLSAQSFPWNSRGLLPWKYTQYLYSKGKLKMPKYSLVRTAALSFSVAVLGAPLAAQQTATRTMSFSNCLKVIQNTSVTLHHVRFSFRSKYIYHCFRFSTNI